MARFIPLGFFQTVARLPVMGFLGALARFPSMGFLGFSARLKFLGFFQELARLRTLGFFLTTASFFHAALLASSKNRAISRRSSSKLATTSSFGSTQPFFSHLKSWPTSSSTFNPLSARLCCS
jgi:hypothetical protein